MLDELVVRNLAVLTEARIQPCEGLTVVTGETGTGKTLLLGALRMLLGQGARPDLIGPFDDEAVVEGRFVRGDGQEIGAGRRLTAGGRSRAYLDGSIASAAALDEATAGLVEIIGQHDQLGLTKPAEIRRLIDRRLDDAGSRLFELYRATWTEYRRLLADQERLGGDRHALARELDLVKFQADEIARAGLAPGDDAELEARLERLRNAEDLRIHLGAASVGVDRARDGLGSTVAELRRARSFDRSLEGIVEESEALEARLGDFALEIESLADGLEVDAGELEEAEARHQILSDLRRKYGPTLDAVLAFGADASRRAADLDALLSRAERVGRDIADVRARLDEIGSSLRHARERAARMLIDDAIGHLKELGFSAPLLEADISPGEIAAHGADTSSLRFASDERLTAGDIGRVASGGELSRLVLSLRLAGGSGEADTLVFDEIDAGIGGATALAMGRKLHALAGARQVLCVTHLPQVAAFADAHYVIVRAGQAAEVRRVEGPERVEELSRMLAGLPDSERGREAAGELLELARGA